MLKKAAKKWNIDFKKSYMVGDRWKDMDAGATMNCRTIFIDYNYDEIKPKLYDYKFKSISKMTKEIGKII
jgi:D-glycero-D-manno-heptose 1,7-bisphosphate phosphatase